MKKILKSILIVLVVYLFTSLIFMIGFAEPWSEYRLAGWKEVLKNFWVLPIYFVVLREYFSYFFIFMWVVFTGMLSYLAIRRIQKLEKND